MKKFCVIDCDHAPAWRERPFSAMFKMLLECPGDEWDIVHVDAGEAVPSKVDEYAGVVITGSRHCCRDADSLPWFEQLCTLVRTIYGKGSPQLYGGCFGCQIIAHALGGSVDKNPSGLFYLKAEILKQVNQFDIVLGENSSQPEDFKVLVSHGDCVLRLPPNSVVIAKSETCDHEIYSCGAGAVHNILACQSHPEFELDYCVKQRIWPSVVSSGRLTAEQQSEYQESFSEFSREIGSDQLMLVIKQFLHKE
jgi:GMP synthase-like glutamine amidotransferase